MRKTFVPLILLLFSLPLLAQPLPDSTKQTAPKSPAERNVQLLQSEADSAQVKASSGRKMPDSAKPKPQAEKKILPPEEKPVDAKLPKPLPRVVVLDFVNAGGALVRLSKSIAERMRFYLLNSGLCRVVDAGETGTAIAELGIARPDSAGREQLALLAQKLKADYIITGLITDYREGDIEFKKHKIELMGKIFWGNNGELCGMEAVKVKQNGEVQDMANDAAEKLGKKIVGKIK